MHSVLIKASLIAFYIVCIQAAALNTTGWLGDLLNDIDISKNPTKREAPGGPDSEKKDGENIHVTAGGKEDHSKKEIDEKIKSHPHIDNIDLNLIRGEYLIENAKERFICLYENFCQNITKFYISPLNNFLCTNENLLVHLDIKTMDSVETVNNPNILKGTAFLPPKGQFQRYQKPTSVCALVRR